MITSYELFLESIKDSDFIYNKYYVNKISKEDYEAIRSGLGDGVNKLSEGSKWIIDLYLNNKFLLEDLYKAKEYLDLYFKYKNRLNTPLNTLNSIQELFTLIKDYRETEEVSFSNEEERKLYGSGQYKEVFKNNKYRIIIPITLEASKYFGKRTQWCTTSENNFKIYTKKQNPDVINIYNLYILYTENPKDRLQFHFKSIQYMDIDDKMINIKHFFDNNKDIYDFFNKEFNVDDYLEKIDINLYNTDIKTLKNQNIPNVINGGFFCHNNKLVSLKGVPKEVGGGFICDNNQLTSLEGAPMEVGGSFYCGKNKLTSLEGAPMEVGGGFYCHNNQLTSLEGAPSEVGGNFDCRNNPDLPKEEILKYKESGAVKGIIYSDHGNF